MLFCSKENKHLISSPCSNFPDPLKTDVFSQFIERMYSYVVLGYYLLRWNNFSLEILMPFICLKTDKNQGGLSYRMSQ